MENKERINTIKDRIRRLQEIGIKPSVFATYLDIPLKKTYGTISGDFGSSRKITDDECNEYLEDFKKVIPDITKEDLRYVFYCYYNGVDAPDCYEVGEWDYDN